MPVNITKWVIIQKLTRGELHNLLVLAYIKGIDSFYTQRWIDYPVFYNGLVISPWLMGGRPVAAIVSYDKAIRLLSEETSRDIES